jgi:hypothetical protein
MRGKWPPGLPTNRQRHWLKNLKRKIIAHFGIVSIPDHLTVYDELLSMGYIPVSSSV